jgi:hypothetical protein
MADGFGASVDPVGGLHLAPTTNRCVVAGVSARVGEVDKHFQVHKMML